MVYKGKLKELHGKKLGKKRKKEERRKRINYFSQNVVGSGVKENRTWVVQWVRSFSLYVTESRRICYPLLVHI